MAKIYLWSGISGLVNEEQPIKIEGNTVHDLLVNLKKKYPNLISILDEGVSFSVDNKLVLNSVSHKVGKHSEVYIFQKISGG